MNSADNQKSTEQTDATPNTAVANDGPWPEGVYIHLVGHMAIRAAADGKLAVFAYDPGTQKAIPGTELPFLADQGQTVLILSNAHLVAEVPKDQVDDRLNDLKLGEPHLKVVVEGARSSTFNDSMTPDIPPAGTGKSNQVG